MNIRHAILVLAASLVLAGCKTGEKVRPEDSTIEVPRATGKEEKVLGEIRAQPRPVGKDEVLQVVAFQRCEFTRREILLERFDGYGKIRSSQMRWEESTGEWVPSGRLRVSIDMEKLDRKKYEATDVDGKPILELADYANLVNPGESISLRLRWKYDRRGKETVGSLDLPVEETVLKRIRATFSPDPPGSSKNSYSELIKDVNFLRGSGRLAEAEAKCRKYCELAPDERMGWELLGQILSQDRRYIEAAETCSNAAQKVASGAENLLVSAARYYENACELDLAREMYERAYERSPDYSRIHSLYHFALRHAPDLTDTKWKIASVIPASTPPFKGILCALMARCEYEIDGRERAVRAIEGIRAQLTDERDIEAFERDLFSMMCSLVFPLSDLEAQAKRLIETSTGYAFGNALGVLRGGLRAFPRGYEAFALEAALAFYAKIGKTRLRGHNVVDLGEILLWAQDGARAAPILLEAVETETNKYLKARALRLLVEWRLSKGEGEEAGALLDKYGDALMQDANAARQLARAFLADSGDPERAVDILKKAFEKQTPIQKFYTGFDYARALRKLGRVEEAMEVAVKCKDGMGIVQGTRFMASFLDVFDESTEGPLEIIREALKKTKDPKEKTEILLLLSDYLLHRKVPLPGEARKALDEAEKLAMDSGRTVFEMEQIWSRKCLLANNYLNDDAMQDRYMNMLLSLRPRHENYRLWKAIALARFGESREEAWRAFEKIPPRKNLAYNRACFYSNVGEHEKAIDLLRQDILSHEDVESRNRQRLWAAADAEFRAIRHLPAFKKLVELEKE